MPSFRSLWILLLAALAGASPAVERVAVPQAADSAGAAAAVARPEAGAPADTSLVPPAPLPPGTGGDSSVEPWQIEGNHLQGTDKGGSEIQLPRVRHGVLTITALTAWVSPDRDVMTFRDHVHMADTSRVVTSDQAVYRRSTRVLTLTGKVRGHGRDGDFTAGEAVWDRLRNHLTLRDGPWVSEPDRQIWAERFEVETTARTGTAYGSVRVLLLPDSTRAYGDEAAYDDLTGRTRLTGNPRLHNPGAAGEPATEVNADTLLLNQAERMGEARERVHVLRGDLRAVCRRGIFYLKDNRMQLFGEPVTWDPDGEIHADTMSVRIHEHEADQLKAYGRVLVHYEPRDKPGEENLVLGDTLVAGLRGGAVTDMEVRGSAVSLYLPALGDAREGSGRNLCRGKIIHIFLERGEANRVDLIHNASGTYLYPGEGDRRRLIGPEADSLLPPELRLRTAAADSGKAAAADSSKMAAVGNSRAAAADSGKVAAADSSKAAALPEEPPEPGPQLKAFAARRTLDLPDSLRSGYDKLFSERVDYEGDTIRFYVPEHRIQILGTGKLRYRGNELKSREINYRADRSLITALGSPNLSDAQDNVAGVKMTYRTDEHDGIIYRGRTVMDNAHYYGEEIKKLANDALLVRRGDYTTCENDSAPDYHFHASRMKMIMRDKVVARPVVLFLKHVPVMALPYYVFPIRKGRRSGVLMPDAEFGVSKNKGRFVRNLGYYWAISDYMDARSWIDYYDQGPRIYFNGVYNYNVRYLLNGNVDGSYLKENQTTGGRTVGYSLRANHSQILGEGANLTMRADFESDKNYRGTQDFGASVDDRLQRTLTSSLGATKRWSGASLTFAANHTQYLDATTLNGVRISRQAPSLDFSISPITLGHAPDAAGRGGKRALLSGTTVGSSLTYRNVYTQWYGGKISANQAAQQNVNLNDNRSLGSFLRIGSGISGSWAAFARDNLKERWRSGGSWSASASASNTLYGTFRFPVKPLLGIRHIVQPSVSYRYSPEFRRLTYADSTGTKRSRFPSVGGIGLSGAKNSALSFGLDQRWHAKWARGSKVVTKENILQWSTNTSYDFMAKKLPGTARARPLSTISNSIHLRPFNTFDNGISFSHDPYTRVPLNFSVSTNLRITGDLFRRARSDSSRSQGALDYGGFGDAGFEMSNRGPKHTTTSAPEAKAWSLSLAHSYSTQRGVSKPSNTLNTRLSMSPTRNWQLDMSIYLDLHQRRVTQHQFSLYRDMHCWEMRFERTSSGTNSEWRFHIGIKQIPDVHYERQSS